MAAEGPFSLSENAGIEAGVYSVLAHGQLFTRLMINTTSAWVFLSEWVNTQKSHPCSSRTLPPSNPQPQITGN